MKDVLFLAHRIPYPPNKGDKIRAYRWIKALAGDYRVHLGTFIDDPRDWPVAPGIAGLCTSIFALPLRRARATARSLSGLLTGAPLTVPYYSDSRMHKWVASLTRSTSLAAAVAYSSSMAQYVPAQAGARRILDMVDVDSDKWRQYSSRKVWPVKWLYRREARALAAYESRLTTRFDRTLLVSQAEAELLGAQHGADRTRIACVGNGVDCDYFDPQVCLASPYELNRRVIVFTGAMDYWANVDAVCWFAQSVLPAIAAHDASVQFYVVGSNPAAAVSALVRDPRVRVTGWVADVRPYLAHAALAIAPLRIARGVQNKVLEAMAMGMPVVATSFAMQGIGSQSVPGVRIATDADEFAAAVRACLGEPTVPRSGSPARRYVTEHFSWGASVERFMGQVAGTAGQSQASPAAVAQ
jgi:sugar transferase (PEP-CTERM/EpsH1 system associated)